MDTLGIMQALNICSGLLDDPLDSPTFTNLLLYFTRCAARPLGFFFFSAFATLGV